MNMELNMMNDICCEFNPFRVGGISPNVFRPENRDGYCYSIPSGLGEK